MNRSVETLLNRRFDVVVVGGGIYGACLAWEASSHGLSVALVDKGDFGWATSANMHRILHGGFRYLRNADVKRIRESVRERNVMMRLAPHLTDPMPFLVPTYERGIQHREVMRVALKLYDMLSYGRNRGIEDASRQIPPGRIISREECLRLAPGLDPRGVTGGAIWYDGALRDPVRLILELIRTAAEAGACAANYVEVTGFLRNGASVAGVNAVDLMTGDDFQIQASVVVSAAGPWNDRLLAKLGQDAPREPTRHVRSVDVVTRALTLENHGLALMGPQHKAPSRTIRYFIAPWRELSVVGSVDYLESTDPDDFRTQASELEYLIRVVRSCMPGSGLGVDDIICVQAGLIPHAGREPLRDPYNAARHYCIVDHGKLHGVGGLVSIMGIKYTTARDIAEKTIDLILRKLAKPPLASRTAAAPLHGGSMESFDDLLSHAITSAPHGLSATVMEQLVRSYGSGYKEVLAHVGEASRWAEPIAPSSAVIKAQIVHAVHREMAVRLSDVVLRRTGLGTLAHPGSVALRACADLMAGFLGWNEKRIENEIVETNAHLERFWARPAADGQSQSQL
ncbi:MAG: glycerol-3-phosphate dehydrogenase/oxidase [Gammaproteobacteria bacterium]